MFEVATREKYRFPFKGLVSVEDLWDLTLSDLDGIYKTLNKELKAVSEDSLLDSKSAEDTIANKKIDIVKHIVLIKLAEKKARAEASLKREQKQKILGIIAEKQDVELRGKSLEDLTKMVDDL